MDNRAFHELIEHARRAMRGRSATAKDETKGFSMGLFVGQAPKVPIPPRDATQGNITMTVTGNHNNVSAGDVWLSPSRKTDITPTRTCAADLNREVPELEWRPCGKEDDRRDLCGANLPTGEWVQVRWNWFDKAYTVYVYDPDNKTPAAGVSDVDARACVVDALAQYQGSEAVLDALYAKVPGVGYFISRRGRITQRVGLALCVLTGFLSLQFWSESALWCVLYAVASGLFAVVVGIPYFGASDARNRRLAQARVTFNALVLASAGAKTVDDMPAPAQAGTLALVDEEKVVRLARMMELTEAGGLPTRESMEREEVLPVVDRSGQAHSVIQSAANSDFRIGLDARRDGDNEGLPHRVKPSAKPMMPSQGHKSPM